MKRTACISARICACRRQRVDKRLSRHPPALNPVFPRNHLTVAVFINYSDNVGNFTSPTGDALIRNNSHRIVMKITNLTCATILYKRISLCAPLYRKFAGITEHQIGQFNKIVLFRYLKIVVNNKKIRSNLY